jgi:hypothetical protein
VPLGRQPRRLRQRRFERHGNGAGANGDDLGHVGGAISRGD